MNESSQEKVAYKEALQSIVNLEKFDGTYPLGACTIAKDVLKAWEGKSDEPTILREVINLIEAGWLYTLGLDEHGFGVSMEHPGKRSVVVRFPYKENFLEALTEANFKAGRTDE